MGGERGGAGQLATPLALRWYVRLQGLQAPLADALTPFSLQGDGSTSSGDGLGMFCCNDISNKRIGTYVSLLRTIQPLAHTVCSLV